MLFLTILRYTLSLKYNQLIVFLGQKELEDAFISSTFRELETAINDNLEISVELQKKLQKAVGKEWRKKLRIDKIRSHRKYEFLKREGEEKKKSGDEPRVVEMGLIDKLIEKAVPLQEEINKFVEKQ